MGLGVSVLFRDSGIRDLRSLLFESLLFFNDLTSNNVVCKRPTNQTFKCSVYKNGQVIQDL